MTSAPPGHLRACDSTIGDVVEGLTEIAGLPIPYARLPRRARALWGHQLHTWADVADRTPASLLSQPRVGESLLTALLDAANEAVRTARTVAAPDAATAAQRLLDRFNERDRTVLKRRLWTFHPEPAEKVAQALGVSPTALRRRQAGAEHRYRELLDDRTHADLIAYADGLRGRVGTVTTLTALNAALSHLSLDHDSVAARLLTHIAGPYQRQGGWLEHPKGAVTRAETAVRSTLAHNSATTEGLLRELHRAGLCFETAADFLDLCPQTRQFDDRWVWWGDSAAAQIEALLHLSRQPMSSTDLAAQLEKYSEAVIRATLSDNTRFVRASRHTWALREWGQEQYAGIFNAIMARVDAAGAIPLVDLVRDMKAAFPDVAEISIRTYAAKPAFVVEHGLLRRRTPQDGWRAVPPLSKARGVFCNGVNEIRVCYRVDRELLRGSGQSVVVAVAAALEVRPGGRRVFSNPHAKVTVVWPFSGTKGPTVGSLRVLASAVDAQHGDELVLAFDVTRGTVSAERISSSAGDDRRLAILTGTPTTDARDALAESVGCPPGDVVELLRSRGDGYLAHLVDQANHYDATAEL